MPMRTSAVPPHGTLTDAQLSLYRSVLEEQWRRQLDHLVGLSHDALSATDGSDDLVARTTDQLLNSQLVAAARQQLQETEDALVRLNDGTYGSCGSCATAIGPARLEVLPAARLCVACQSRRTSR